MQKQHPVIVDSHCHLNRIDLTDFNGDLETVLSTAKAHGVEHFLTVSVEIEDLEELKKIAQKYPQVSYSVGWHPTSVASRSLTSWLIQEGQNPRCVAIGETGLDYYHLEQESDKKIQHDLFRQHIEAAKYIKKPLIIHTRQASEDTIAILKAESARDARGVMHCFTEDWTVAKQALDLDFMISLSGIVTFKNASIVHDVARQVPLDALLIETDAPYLAPVPFRGKSNHPAWVKYVCEAIASLRGISVEEVAEATTSNFYKLFSVHKDDK
jgi:TatD DNase family protein